MYMVCVEGREAPRKQHSTMEAALAEAYRLAAMSQNSLCTIYVFEVKVTLVPKATHEAIYA